MLGIFGSLVWGRQWGAELDFMVLIGGAEKRATIKRENRVWGKEVTIKVLVVMLIGKDPQRYVERGGVIL
jgi:hypothetical protein